MFSNRTLFIRFTIYSLISFVITGIVLGFLISYHIRTDMIVDLLDMERTIDNHIKELNNIIFMVMFLGLLILYLLLMKIIYNASKTLIAQNKTLQKQKEDLQVAYNKLNCSYKSTISTLSSAVDARDPYTAGHSERVTELSLRVGYKLGCCEESLNRLELASLFHDVGKLGIPDTILLKPGKLTDKEFNCIKRHPEIGVKILKNIDYLHEILPIILHHHENFASNGYPDGISGDNIPLESRIIAVTDSYDAMTSDRPYRKAISHEQALLEIIECKGKQFDPNVVQAFITLFE